MRRPPSRWPSAEDCADAVDPTPGDVVPPPGVLPGWNWLPEGGLHYDVPAQPWWVRMWLGIPVADRYAHVWMWHYGGYSFPPPTWPNEGGDTCGDREPRVPRSPPPSLQLRRPLNAEAPHAHPTG